MYTLIRHTAFVLIILGLAYTVMACSVLRPLNQPSSANNAIDASHQPTAEAEIQSITENYRNWQSISDQPHRVVDYIYSLCRLAADEEFLAAESLHGPFYVRVFVNDIGADALFNDPDPIYPVGTVIVKEKSSGMNATFADNLGIMIKREAGFNPAGGDWEYIYWESGDVFQPPTADLSHCQACHISEAEDDSIFRLGSPQAAYTYDNIQPVPTGDYE